MAMIIKPLGKWLKELFKINGTTIERLIDQVLFAKPSVSEAIWVYFMLSVILEMSKNFLKILLLASFRDTKA